VKYFFLFFITFLATTGIRGQVPVHINYRTEHGLPSSEVYDAAQDRHGYLWFATDHGLSRYDGYRYENFDKQNGLPESTVFNFRKDPWGRLWVNSFNSYLAIIDNLTIKAYRYNEELSEYIAKIKPHTTILQDFMILSDSTVMFSLIAKGKHLISKDGSITDLQPGENCNCIEIDLTPGGLFLNSQWNAAPQSIVVNLSDGRRIVNPLSIFNDIGQKSVQTRAVRFDSTVYLSLHDHLFQLIHGQVKNVLNFDDRIITLATGANGTLYVGTLRSGLHVFAHGDLSTTPEILLDEVAVSSVLFDHEGSLWLTTLNNGVYQFPDPLVTSYDEASQLPMGKIIDIESDRQQRHWIALDKFRLVEMQAGKLKPVELPVSAETEISDLKWDVLRQRLWIGTNTYLYYLENNKVYRFLNDHELSIKGYKGKFAGIKEIVIDQATGTIWLGSFSGLARVNSKGNVDFMSNLTHSFTERVESLDIDASGIICMGTLNGLWQFENGVFSSRAAEHPILNERITRVVTMGDTLLLGTRGNGLLILTSDSLYQLTQQQGLTGNSVNYIVYNSHYIITGTNSGLSFIDRAKPLHTPVKTLTNTSLIPSQEISSLFLADDKLFVGTNSGLIVFPADIILKPLDPLPLLITTLNIGGENCEVRNGHRIPFRKNAVHIDYFAISFLNTGRLTYKHRLIGLEDEWVINQKTNASYPYLPPGEYIFELNVMNQNGSWNPESVTLSFSIIRPYWQTVWFVLLIIFVGSAILFLLINRRIRAIHKRNNLVDDLNRYRQEALISQMNPHFMFNALNTVQRFILENDRLASSRYLSKFARLMRRFLESSQKQSISINEEFEALSLYLELEAARFREKFTYMFYTSPNINRDKMHMPVYIIQPLVENAIWHGLMNCSRPGRIEISIISSNGNDMVCKVKDNGIGRAEAAKLKASHDRKSLGISIIQKRLSLINTRNSMLITLQINDLTDDDGHASGTEAVIVFPGWLKN
jgi:sensor histidine kinase YesM/ligand-binding sensor domain-containing protein